MSPASNVPPGRKKLTAERNRIEPVDIPSIVSRFYFDSVRALDRRDLATRSKGMNSESVMNFLISLDGKLRIYGELFGMRRKRRIGNFRFGVSSFIPPWQKLLSARCFSLISIP